MSLDNWCLHCEMSMQSDSGSAYCSEDCLSAATSVSTNEDPLSFNNNDVLNNAVSNYGTYPATSFYSSGSTNYRKPPRSYSRRRSIKPALQQIPPNDTALAPINLIAVKTPRRSRSRVNLVTFNTSNNHWLSNPDVADVGEEELWDEKLFQNDASTLLVRSSGLSPRQARKSRLTASKNMELDDRPFNIIDFSDDGDKEESDITNGDDSSEDDILPTTELPPVLFSGFPSQTFPSIRNQPRPAYLRKNSSQSGQSTPTLLTQQKNISFDDLRVSVQEIEEESECSGDEVPNRRFTEQQDDERRSRSRTRVDVDQRMKRVMERRERTRSERRQDPDGRGRRRERL